jgi:hypothetical protein
MDDQRVSWNPSVIRNGDTIEIQYQGLLKNSGAEEVFLHYGFDSWSHTPATVKMEKQQNGSFNKQIAVEGNHEVNLCFKDALGNWDNNDGWNWNIHLE